MWRAFHAKGLANNGVTSQIISYVSDVIRKFNPHNTIICWDVGGSRWRLDLFRGYKQDRDKRKQEIDLDSLYAQAQTAADFLEMQGIKQISAKGVEGDDLISWFSEYYLKYRKYDKILIFTRDKDLWQLITDNILIYDGHRNKIINKEFVRQEYSIDPEFIPDLKALMGDAGDGIKGIKGIGEKTALSLIHRYGFIGDMLDQKNISDLKKKKKTAKLVSDAEEAYFSYQLVKLPDLICAKFVLNTEESKSLTDSICKAPVKDEQGYHMLAGTFGGMESNFFSVPKQEEIDLTGILPFFEQEDQRSSCSNFQDLDKAILECNKCALRGCCGAYGPTLAEGYTDTRIMCVGRNPGSTELVEGRPLCGPAGKRFEKLLTEVGLTRRDCWLTNICKCHSENNRVPTYGEIMACAEYIRSEVDLLKPNIIMVFGNEAMSLFTPYKSGVTKHCGEILDNPTG